MAPIRSWILTACLLVGLSLLMGQEARAESLTGTGADTGLTRG